MVLLAIAIAQDLIGQQPSSWEGAPLRWRSIGPLRGGRTRAAAGVPTRPYTFYMAQVNGGVWKTDDAGRTWKPIFDEQPTQSVGVIAVAPSDNNTVYVGSGEGLPRPDLSVGDGVYKSTDGGSTWQHMGLREAQQIPMIAVDPISAFRIFVAVLGHPYGPSKERGIYRSLDGGQTFTPVLQRDENVGGNDVDIDPTNAQVVYANLWEHRQGPWENAAWTGGGGGLYKSLDGGETWKQLTNGLPPTTNQVNLAIAPSNSRRLYAAVASNGPPATVGIYRSDDAGETWTKITDDTRPAARIGGGDLPNPVVDPKNPDVVIMATTVSMKSTDGGKHWVPFKGAPGGDDYQNVWINPSDPNIILLVADQGSVVTLNGGQTWSSWYNQSTAQMYHVMADNAFPYRLCSGQQESGSACVSSRGDWGEITMREWAPVGVDEYGYVAPDPLDPDIVYGGRAVTRFDRRTGQNSIIGPLAGRVFAPGTSPYRQVRTQPVVFSQADPKTLFFANNFLWKTTNGGVSWRQISPDLTRKTWDIPASVGKYTDQVQVTQRGVIYTVGPSPLNVNNIWVGTDDGLIHHTTDGGLTWKDVTPPQIGAWWKVFMIDAGHFEQATAYAAVNTLRLDDMKPHFFKTHDGGRTWEEMGAGKWTAADGPANAVREDPKRRGLLYAATEKGVWVSFDDGGNWESLQLNLPHTSIRDLIVKDDDIAVGTHGRGFWILDDITPLRQMSSLSSAPVGLLKPAPALRVRWNTNDDTPLPPDEPMGENPPEGAPINYFLDRSYSEPVTLEILDARGRVVRTYANTDSLPWKIPADSTTPLPRYWYRTPRVLPATAGLNRFHWDVRYQPLTILASRRANPFGDEALPISATPHNTAPAPTVPFVAPGTYTVRLTVNTRPYTYPIVVKQDPRVKTSALAMREVYSLTDSMYFTLRKLQDAITQAGELRALYAISDTLKHRAIGVVLDAPAAPDTSRRGTPAPAPPGGGAGPSGAITPVPAPGTLRGAATALGGLLNVLQAADVPVTVTQRTSILAALASANQALTRWNELRARYR
ncbi:MAG TPA: hypothetical protein VFT29_05660 [Gemmatimonadaceae bacterium]|nr:hypothetical protein [Gemmatimonadaceae bacterium]